MTSTSRATTAAVATLALAGAAWIVALHWLPKLAHEPVGLRKQLQPEGFQNPGSVRTEEAEVTCFWFTRAREYQIVSGFAR
jgi:hypothetical protein